MTSGSLVLIRKLNKKSLIKKPIHTGQDIMCTMNIDFVE